MRPVYILFVFFLSFSGLNQFQVYGQISEVGFGLGGLTYTGDLERGYNITHNRPAANLFFRAHIRDELSFRANTVFGLLEDSDDNAFDALGANRRASFSIAVIEASTLLEYYFLDYRINAYQRWSPYLYGGIGIFGFAGEGERNAEFSNIQFTIPFGMGVKYVLNPIWVIGLEFGPRLTFFDYLDNFSEGDLRFKNFQYGNPNDNDLYYFLGITLSYSFYKIPCPYPSN